MIGAVRNQILDCAGNRRVGGLPQDREQGLGVVHSVNLGTGTAPDKASRRDPAHVSCARIGRFGSRLRQLPYK